MSRPNPEWLSAQYSRGAEMLDGIYPPTPNEVLARTLWAKLMAGLETGIEAASRLQKVLRRVPDPASSQHLEGSLGDNLPGIVWGMNMQLSFLEGIATSWVNAARESLTERWLSDPVEDDDDDSGDDEPEDQLPPDEPLTVRLPEPARA